MRYDFTKRKEEDIRVFEVRDANGLEWKHVIFCDTDTGEIEYVVYDDQGPKLDSEGNEIMKATVKTASPLRITPTPGVGYECE